ncbi:glycosyltransferase family 4 protein [Patescibacteria group bacterium]|nr:glycosyltransferase family 4 protein [Patescibacteria group bacterium]
MKVLHANKFYYLQGGTERYFIETMELLEKEKIQCVPFAMHHPKNLETPYSKYFVSNVDFSKVSFSKEGFRVAGRMLYSFEAKKKVEKLIEDEKPDIAHIHNIYHQISPSILPVFKNNNIPVVMSVQDHKIICPDFLLCTNHPKLRYCQDCKRHKYYKAIQNKCIKESYMASTLTALEMSFHKLVGYYERFVDTYIAPSNFVKELLIEWGYPEKKIVTIPLYVKHDERPYSFMYDSQNPYIIYWGRHSKEKGVRYLVAAMEKLPHVKCIICGTGPEHEELKQIAKDKKIDNVVFLGFVPDEDLTRIARDAQFVIVPSVFPENFGLVVTEGFAFGKPVIGPKRGAPTELIDVDRNGLLFEAQNATDLAEKIDSLWNKKDKISEMGKEARRDAETLYDPKLHIERLITTYNTVLKKNK